jgi:hypothetical protein
MPSLSRQNAEGGGSGGATYGGGAFHGFRKDAEGKLYYNKVSLSQRGASVNLTDGSVLDDPTDAGEGGRNDAVKKTGETYDQWFIDSLQMNFYINDDGFLVAKINEPYTYTGAN